jgi:DMSO/TMAO reductase YedYZ molybdopterin-dependent catalytic subunit
VKDVAAMGGAREPYRRFPIRHIPDAWHEAGPLGGIATALASTKHQYAFAVPCDAPLFEGRAIALSRELIGDADAAIYEVEGRLNATFALYRKSSCLAVFRRALELGRFRLLEAVADLNPVIISERQWRKAGISPTAFLSANTPEELAKLIGYYETGHQTPSQGRASPPKTGESHHHHRGPQILPARLRRADWLLTISGCGKCRRPHLVRVDDLEAYPRVRCATALRCAGQKGERARWEGIPLRRILRPGHLAPGIRSAVLYGRDGHWSALSARDLFASNAVFVTQKNGKALRHRDGGPVRLIVPEEKGWKSVKWIVRIGFTKRLRRGHRHKAT